jgi:WD40 repeat protein
MTKKKIGELAGHEDIVTALSLSPDGRFALTGSEDQTVRVWDLPSGRCIRTFKSVGGTVDAVYFDPSNRYALSLTAGGQLRLWNIASLCFPKLMFHAPLLVSHVTSSEEVSRQQAEMDRYCNAIRRAVRELDIAGALQFIEKAKTLNRWETARNTLDAEGIGDLVQRYSVRQALANVLCTHTFLGHDDTVTAIATSLDANIIASSGRDATIRIWNVTEQKCVNIIEGHADWVRSVEMTTDSKFLVSGSWDNSVRVWNLGNGQCVRKFGEKVKYVTKVALNPQGRLIAIANGSGSVILWDVLTDEVVFRTIAHSGGINTIRFNRNGHYLVTGGDDNLVKIWQLGQEEPTRTVNVHKSPVTSATLSTDLTRLYSADRSGRVVIWNLLTDAVEYEFQGHLSDISVLEPLSDDRFLLTCAKDAKVRLSGLEDRSIQRIIEGHPAPVQALSLEISGRRFVTGSDDAVVRVWELHWNYQFPGWSKVTPKAESVLKILLSLYSPDVFGLETPKIDEAVIKRIVLEMEYRGFGVILPEELKKTIDRLIADWHGPGTVQAL